MAAKHPLPKPTYAQDKGNLVYQQLKKEVAATVKTLAPVRQWTITVKAILFPVLYVGCYALALAFGQQNTLFYLFYVLMGFMLVVNFLNLIHEAVHGTLFRRKVLNQWYTYFFDLMGANSYVWKIRHTKLHHQYPNIMHWDSDFEQSPVARVFPHAAYERIHRYQPIYLPLLYPFYLFNWLLIRDFKDYFNRRQLVWKVADLPRVEYLKLFLFKAIFLGYTLVVPALLLPGGWSLALAGFAGMMLSASLLSLVVLLSPHASLESDFPDPGPDGKMPHSFFVHQLATTNDVQQDNWFTRFFMGCFNYHIAHHLFPSVHHVYYPEVTRLIEEYAVAHELPYRRVGLGTSLLNHYRLLRANAQHENIFEETM